jgi:hypothetical protein
MNIFVLDSSPDRAAQYHCNSHVVKMILEQAQLMCTSHWLSQLDTHKKVLGDFRRVRDMQEWLLETVPLADQPPWKITHINHPCAVWTRASVENYRWGSELGLALCAEYTRRYRKRHRSQCVHEWLEAHTPNLPSIGLTPWAQCVPEDCRGADTVQAYRDYYNKHKSRFAQWEPRAMTPSWYRGY